MTGPATMTPHPTPSPDAAGTAPGTCATAAPQLDGDAVLRPFITVVMPVRNEAGSIRNVLEQLLAQQYPLDRFEIIVADGESTDATPAIVAEIASCHDNVRLVRNPRRWSSAGRNLGFRQARGDIVVVVDGHCEIGDDRFLSHLADAFCSTDADCVGRPQPLDVAGATAFQAAVAAARSSWLGHHPDSHVYSSQERFVPAMSVGVAYRRHVFEGLGGFDERFDACEDVEFNYRADRAGFRCYFTPRVTVRYRPRADLVSLFCQLARYGRGRMRLFRKHPETLSIKSFLPAVFVGGCLAGVGLAWVSRWLWLLYLSALAIYGLVVLATSTAIAMRQRRWALAVWLPWIFVAIHFGAGFGILQEVIRGTPPNTFTGAPRHQAGRGSSRTERLSTG